MRNLLCALSIVVLSASLAMAADKPATPMAVTAPVVVSTEKTVMGTVKSVSTSEIVITVDAGKAVNVLVTATTTLYDADAKAITLDKIVAGSKVDIVYTVNAQGANEAKSVKVAK